jgi:hypothetical protein
MTGPDVMGREEAATLLNVSQQRVGQLIRDDPMFPKGRKLARGLIWDAPELRAYAKDRRRPKTSHTKVLQSYRKTGNIAQAARTAGCAVTTARRVLRDVGLLEPTRDES